MNQLVALFPGQGTQMWGMGKKLYIKSSEAKQVYDLADSLLGYSFSDILFNTKSEEKMGTSISQLAIFVTSVAYYKAYIEKNHIVPQYYAGHSVGEYAALVCSGMISFKDGLFLVQERGRLMQKIEEQMKTGAMMAVLGLNYNEVEKICLDCEKKGLSVAIANYNDEKQVVVAGIESELEIVSQMINKQNGKVKRLVVNAAFHSKYMEAVVEPMRTAINKIELMQVSAQVYSNVTGKVYGSQDEVYKLLPRQVAETVRWFDIIQDLFKKNVRYYLEIGHGSVLGNILLHGNQSDIQIFSLGKEKDLEKFYQNLLEGSCFGGNYLVGFMLGDLISQKIQEQNEVSEEDDRLYQKIKDIYLFNIQGRQMISKHKLLEVMDWYRELSKHKKMICDFEWMSPYIDSVSCETSYEKVSMS